MDSEIVQKSNTEAMVLNGGSMKAALEFANMMAKGVATVPKHLQGMPSDCLAVTMQAMQWNMNPFAVAQKTHLINGTLGYEAQLVNAVVSSSTAIEGRFHYEYSDPQTWKKANDPDAWVKVGAILKGEEEITWGEPLYPATVTTKNSPLWKTNPKQQASYLALKYWSRLYTPAVILGVYTSDELHDIAQEKDITPEKESAIKRPAKPEEEAVDAELVNTDQVEAGETELVPVAQIIETMNACENMEELDKTKVTARTYPSDSNDFNIMVDAYNNRRGEILRAEDEAKLKAQ